MIGRIVHALWDGLRLHCPRCHRGRMFESFFRMRRRCPVCDLAFERSSGEITGGMAINTVVTLFLVIVAALVIGFTPSLPLAPLLIGLAIATAVFAIAFYPISRGLWASVIYLTGDNTEPD
jgi:uncharacterized protein (DUF983 family)